MAGGITHQHHGSSEGITAIGIDVGGQRKGFHAVALTAGRYSSHCVSPQVSTVVEWCHNLNGTVIAVDAPCRWSRDGRARPAERELMAQGIWCFSTPTRRRALEHQKNYYGASGRSIVSGAGVITCPLFRASSAGPEMLLRDFSALNHPTID